MVVIRNGGHLHLRSFADIPNELVHTINQGIRLPYFCQRNPLPSREIAIAQLDESLSDSKGNVFPKRHHTRRLVHAGIQFAQLCADGGSERATVALGAPLLQELN